MAEDELIEIVPNFRYEQVLNLIKGDYGPFIPAIPTKVPLWMALNLYRQQKCKINLPHWIIELDQLNEQQSQEPNSLIKMPSKHWREVIQLLDSHRIPMPHNPKSLVELRENILKKSVHSLLDIVFSIDYDRIAQVKIKNVTKFELATLKTLITSNLAVSKELQSD